MAILKCKMCGGDLHFEEGASTCVCEYCGNTNTLPVVGSDQEMNLFNRANHFRMINEFDRAITAYERILDADDTNAEAHWGIVLSRYGIEYVEDPISHERIPTCHRVQMTSILSDPDYLAAVEHADVVAKAEYKAQAEKIAEIQKGILSISSQEKPYDVFICYKETDENGNRTVDSTLAQDIYYGLTEAGYRVFFARITLEDKLGQQYEPYIFAALNSAKVMVVVGTKPENYNAVWVKNEWSRYLALMKNDRHRLLIPCYRDMDPYDLPDELSMLQSQDMSKIGFMQDLLRGINKVLAKETKKSTQQETVVVQQGTSGTTANAQVMRGNMALEDHEWEKADGFFEEALNLDPKCAEAYIGKLLVEKQQSNWSAWIESLKKQYAETTTETKIAIPKNEAHIEKMAEEYEVKGYLSKKEIRDQYEFNRVYNSSRFCRKRQKELQEKELRSDRLLSRAQQFSQGETRKLIEDGIRELLNVLDQRISDAKKEDADSIESVKKSYAENTAQADQRVIELNRRALDQREKDYQTAVEVMRSADDIGSYKNAINRLNATGNYKDASDLVDQCQKEIKRLEEERRKEEERQAEIKRKEEEHRSEIWRQEIERQERAKKKKRKLIGIAFGAVVVCVIAVFVVTNVVIPNKEYEAVVESMKKYSGSDVGDTIVFGVYEQDNDDANGTEDIEWIVLDKDGENYLLISKYALDCQPYNTATEDVTWADCSLNKWLNSEFYGKAFGKAEARMIVPTTVTADKNPQYDSDAGQDVNNEKVFLLSTKEAEELFSSDSERSCTATEYTKSLDELDYCYWLRTPGENDSSAAYVDMDSGRIDYAGFDIDISWALSIRPSIWVNIESGDNITTSRPESEKAVRDKGEETVVVETDRIVRAETEKKDRVG